MPAMWHNPGAHWVICTRCDGTGKSAGGDCPDCRVDGFPTGWVRVQDGDQ